MKMLGVLTTPYSMSPFGTPVMKSDNKESKGQKVRRTHFKTRLRTEMLEKSCDQSTKRKFAHSSDSFFLLFCVNVLTS